MIRQLLAQVATPVPPTGHIENNVSLSSHQEFTPPRTADTARIQQPRLVTTLPTVNATTLPQTSPPTNPIPMMPAVPTCIRDRILNGEFIDFATLLPQAMFTGGHMEPLKCQQMLTKHCHNPFLAQALGNESLILQHGWKHGIFTFQSSYHIHQRGP